MTSLPRKAMSECVTPLKRGAGGVFDTRCMFQAASAAFTRMTRRAWSSIITESVIPARSPTRGSGLGGVAELLVTGVGALEDDIDVQAAKTDIAASEAAAIDPAARLRETDTMVCSCEGAKRDLRQSVIGRRRPGLLRRNSDRRCEAPSGGALLQRESCDTRLLDRREHLLHALDLGGLI